MGKSIGLGSIRIQPQLYLEDGSRYQSLFDEAGWHESQQEAEPEPFIKAYEAYVHQVKGGALVKSYQKTLSSLRHMMDYRQITIPEWEAATAPMAAPNTRDDKRFANRNILPSIEEVIQKAQKGL